MSESKCAHGNTIATGREFRPNSSDCWQCWPARKRGASASSPARRGLCLHLGKRTEYRPGCGGRMCRHECLAGEPEAVPGGVCQTCPKWQADGP